MDIKLFKNKNNYVDLDNTVRNGSSKDSKVFDHAKAFIDYFNCTILTNNCDYFPDELKSHIKMDVPLICPLTNIKKIIDEKKLIPLVIGKPSIKKYLGHIDIPEHPTVDDLHRYNAVIIYGNIMSEPIKTIGIATYLIKKLQTVYIYENFEYGPLSEMVEETLPFEIEIPFIGAYLKMINYSGEIIDFGKISLSDANFGIMIGDVLCTDGEVCKKNNGLFFHILKDESPLKWNGKYFTVGNIDILYESIINLIESNK